MDNKENIFQETENYIRSLGFQISDKDQNRPWGGFFVIEENQSLQFAEYFFPGYKIMTEQKISPKILLVGPGKKLSWQYHFRRSELWKLIKGEAGIIRSFTDVQGELEKMINNESVELKQGERHRLVGLENWGVIAEIWMHTDPQHPSNEEDIVRLQDDFGRN